MSLFRRATNNWPMKLWAVALASGLWFWHVMASNPVETMDIRSSVVLEGTEKDKQYVLDIKSVQITLRAPRETIQELQRRRADVRAVANVQGLEADKEHVVLVKASCDLPGWEDLTAGGIEAEVDHPAIRLMVTQLDRKMVPVEVVYTKQMPPGYALGTPSVVPREVEIRGTKGNVAPVKSVKAFVDPEELLPRPYLVVPVRPVGEAGEYLDATGLEIDPPEVTISAAPEQKAPKLVRVEPRFSGEPAEGYRVVRHVVTPPTVEVTGDAKIVEHLEALETEVININGRSQTFSQAASLRPPEGVTPRNVSSVDVTVVIQRQAGAR